MNNSATAKKKNKRLVIILTFSLLLLLIPFFAMQYSENVNWSAGDFFIAAFLLIVAGFAIELVLRIISKMQYRIIIIALLIVLFFLLWAELAVGLFEKLLSSF